MTTRELIDITIDIGSLLIEYGAEIYRVEDSINRIAAAYGYCGEDKSVEVFAIPTCLLVTINQKGEVPVTGQRRIPLRSANLDRVDRLNNLSRFICSEKPEYSVIKNHISAIKKRRVYSYPVQAFSYAVVGATFALFFGGSWREALSAGIIGVLIKLVSTAVSKVRPSVFFENLVCSMMAASAAVLISATGFTNGFDTVIIGALMTLVPGVTLTNCMRDFIAGDFLAGLYTMVEALLIAVGMAVGAASAIAFLTRILGLA